MVESAARRRAMVLLALVASWFVVAVLVAAAALALPAAAATACPACYGFAPDGAGVYVERSASPQQRAAAAQVVAAARARDLAFYGALRSDPRVFVCVSQACYQRVGGGGSAGMALLVFALFLSPRGLTPVIAAHELSHIELHARLGLVKTWRRAAPQWFDEGVAVVVSDDPRYLAPEGAPHRCLVAPDGPLPSARADWIENARSQNLYAKAACRVTRWMRAHGGAPGVVALIARVAAGAPFDAAYARAR